MDWPLLSALTAEERAAVVDAMRPRRFARGEVLFHEGDPADALHVLISGHLLAYVSTSDGERATLNVMAPGALVGELALVGDGEPTHRSATVAAIDPCETRVLSASAFRDLCRRHPVVRNLLVMLLAQRVRELSDRLLESSRVGLDRRLYRRLLELHAVFDASVPLTQEQLADLVGGTRPTVNQVLQKLVVQGVIELGRGRVRVLDAAALERKAGR